MLSQDLDAVIIWTKNYKLSWNDFLGKNFRFKDNTAANSSLKLHFIPSYNNKGVYSYTIIPVFNRLTSWTISRSPELLNHEQTHFDILEIFARKIRKRFKEAKKNNACDYSYGIIFNSYKDSLDRYQERYDLATDYSLLHREQNFWNIIVAKELKKLDAFSIENLYGIKELN